MEVKMKNSVLKNLPSPPDSLLPRRRAGDETHYYLIDDVQRTIDKTLRVTKKKKLTWNENTNVRQNGRCN
jgi:hypothetical protein